MQQPDAQPNPAQAETILAYKLARKLGINSGAIGPLIAHGYLRVANPYELPRRYQIYLPDPAAMEWLKGMFGPLEKRPLVPLKDIAKMMQTSIQQVRFWCVHYNIQIHLDPLFGELMSIRNFHALNKAFDRVRNPGRVDSQSLLVMHMNMMNAKGKAIGRKPYSRYLEEELHRIAKMPDPERTVRAAAVWQAYTDSRTLAECILKYRKLPKRKSPEAETLEEYIERLEKALEGSGRWRLPRLLTPPEMMKERAARKRRLANEKKAGEPSSES